MAERAVREARRLAQAQYERARRRMVERLMQSGLIDPRVIGAMHKIPRDRFVHQDAMRLQAYEDVALPIGLGQTLSAPSTQARMTEALEVQRHHRVLEIGTGSGYQTAILAELAAKVFTIERHAELARRAMRQLRALGYDTIASMVGDGSIGWNERAPFDRIIVTACAPGMLEALLRQLVPGGVLVAPQAGGRRGQRLVRMRKGEDLRVSQRDLGPCQFVPLVGEAGYGVAIGPGASRLKFA